jgi:hypothetical protein
MIVTVLAIIGGLTVAVLVGLLAWIWYDLRRSR